MNATPMEMLKTLRPNTPWWAPLARRLAPAIPTNNRRGGIDWDILFMAVGSIWILGVFGGAAVAMIAKSLWGDPAKHLIVNACLMGCAGASMLMVMGCMLGSRWKPLSPDQIKQVADILAQPGREGWGESVARWLDTGPLQTRHLGALLRAERREQALARAAEEKCKHDEAMALLMGGAVGAIAQAQALEAHTAPAVGGARQGGRL